MVKANRTHDISFINSVSSEVGLMLARDENGMPEYLETTDSAAAQQFFNTDINYAHQKPEIELVAYGGDHREGLGLEFTGTNTQRYQTGLNIDARFRDNLILGPLSTTVTTPAGVAAAASITNADAETAASGWTNGARTATQNHAGTYSWGSTADEECYQDAVTWAADWQSDTFYFEMYVYTSVASNARIGINDGVTTVYSSYHSGAAGWELLSLRMTLAANATRLRLILDNNYVASTNSYFDDAVLSTPAYGAYAAQCDFNSKHLISKGQLLLVQNANGTQYDEVRSFPLPITDLLPCNISGTDYLFICLGWTTSTTNGRPANYWYMTAAVLDAGNGAAIMSTAATNTMKYMAEYAGTFYGSETNSTVQSTTNPLNGGAAWANSKQIGADATNINSMVSFGGLTYIQKTDGTTYYLNSATPASATVITLINHPGATVQSRMFVWRDENLLIPYSKQSLFIYDGTTLTAIHPALTSNNLKFTSQEVYGIAGDEAYIYALTYNGTSYDLLSGRYENVDGTTDWRWYGPFSSSVNAPSSVMISSHVKKRLWTGNNVGTTDLGYTPVTTKYGNISADSDYTYQSGGYLITPYYHFNLMGDSKAFLKLTLRMNGTTADIYWEAYYRLLGQTSWTEIDSTNKFKTSPSTSRYLGSSTNTVAGTAIQFKFTGVTNDTAVSPVLIAWDLRAIWYPAAKKLIACKINVSDNTKLLDGNKDTQKASAVRSALDDLYDPAVAWPRKFYPIDYDQESASPIKHIKALPPKRAKPVRKDKQGIEWQYDCLFLEVSVS